MVLGSSPLGNTKNGRGFVKDGKLSRRFGQSRGTFIMKYTPMKERKYSR